MNPTLTDFITLSDTQLGSLNHWIVDHHDQLPRHIERLEQRDGDVIATGHTATYAPMTATLRNTLLPEWALERPPR